jgi:hypothetical protein
VAAALLSACFDFASTQGGAGDESDASSASDASSGPGMDAASERGELSVASPDGGKPAQDAAVVEGGEAGPSEGGASGFCATQTRPGAGAIFFCDDFDEGPLPGSWSTFRQTSGTLSLTTAAAVSPPNGLDAIVDPLSYGQAVDVALRTSFAITQVPPTIRLAFRVEPARIDPGNGATIILAAVDFLDAAGDRYTVELSATVASGAITLALGEQSGFADGGQQYVEHPVSTAQTLPQDAFTDVVLAIDGGGSANVRGGLTLGGSQVLDVPLAPSVAPSRLQIGVGAAYVTEPSMGWELRYDDVLFTAN